MLIIVESPAKARTIRSILGNKYTVEASIGHIRAISDERKTKDGRKLLINGIDIEKGFQPIFEIAEGKKDLVSKLKKLAKEHKNQILFATDSDREGESISWHLSEVLGIKDKSSIKRLEFHEITADAIQEAVAHPRPLNTSLVEAQKARQVLDKIVGYRLSPVLWTTLSDYKLSAGRVQSPALVLVFQREKEIEAFKPEEYWEGLGDFANNTSTLAVQKFAPEDQVEEKLPFVIKNLKKGVEAINATTVEEIITDLKNHPKFVVTDVSQKAATSRPRPPFTTSTLQQAASSRLGFAPRLTMSTAQRLYEGVDIDGRPTALITYMRTDSTFLSNEALNKVRSYISGRSPQVLEEKTRYFSSKSKNAQEAHEAIRPTNPHLTPDMLKGKIDARQWKLYDLIWRRTLATQCKDEQRLLTTYTLTNSDGYSFTFTYSKQTEQGYKFYDKTSEKQGMIPSVTLAQGGVYYLSALQLFQKFTQPPGRYSPASLIKKLEELGIGRPSTYASIISTLYDRGYVDENTKSLIPTTLGKTVARILLENFAEVTGNEMTSEMEDGLDKISRHELDYQTLLENFWKRFDAEVTKKTAELKEKRAEYKQVSSEKIPDPSGKGMLVLKLGRFGEYWQNEEDPKIMYPKNFREIEETLKRNYELYGSKVEGLISPISRESLVIRVSKKTLNPYVATEAYTVGSKEKALNIEKLNEMGWTQDSVDKLYAEKPKEAGKGGKRRFFRKKTR